jgi:hypothetical protein
MPSTKDHIKQAKHNEHFFSSLDLEKTAFKDWVVTGVFYAALHWIDAYLTVRNTQPKAHFQRDDWAKKDRKLDPIWPDYRDLKNFRGRASYEVYEFTSDEIRTEVLPLLDSIKTCLLGLEPSLFN